MLLIFHFWSGGHRQLAVQQHSTRNAHNTQQQHIHARTHTPNTSAWLIRTADSIDKRNHAKHSSDTNYKHIQFVFVFHWLNYKRCGVVPLIVKHVHTKPQYEWQCARRAYQFRAHCQELLLSKLLLLLFLRHPTTETNINEISTKNEWERQSCTNCSTVFVYACDTHTHTHTQSLLYHVQSFKNLLLFQKWHTARHIMHALRSCCRFHGCARCASQLSLHYGYLWWLCHMPLW